MRLNEFRPGWPMIMLGIALQAFAAASLGIAGAVKLDYLGVAGAREKGAEVALLWAAGFLLASALFAMGGTALLRKAKQRG
jgi:hypothetical protein